MPARETLCEGEIHASFASLSSAIEKNRARRFLVQRHCHILKMPENDKKGEIKGLTLNDKNLRRLSVVRAVMKEETVYSSGYWQCVEKVGEKGCSWRANFVLTESGSLYIVKTIVKHSHAIPPLGSVAVPTTEKMYVTRISDLSGLERDLIASMHDQPNRAIRASLAKSELSDCIKKKFKWSSWVERSMEEEMKHADRLVVVVDAADAGVWQVTDLSSAIAVVHCVSVASSDGAAWHRCTCWYYMSHNKPCATICKVQMMLN